MSSRCMMARASLERHDDIDLFVLVGTSSLWRAPHDLNIRRRVLHLGLLRFTLAAYTHKTCLIHTLSASI